MERKGPDRLDDQTVKAADLLAKARKLRDKTASPEGRAPQTPRGSFATDLLDTLRVIAEQLTFFRKLIHATKETSIGFYERFLHPIWRIIRRPILLAGRLYGKVWIRTAFVTDKATGERVVSRKRASITVGITILFLIAFTPTTPGSMIRFFTIEPVIDGFLMAVSKKTERFYLSHSEEIDPVENVFSVRGCRTEIDCTEKDAAYFRVSPRLSHDIWKLVSYGNPVYVPDHVVAPIAPGVNRCEVTYYGYRMTSSWISRLLRSLEVYPTMLETSCTHLGAYGRDGVSATTTRHSDK